MQVDVSFSFAKVYNVEKLDVVKGQKFSLFTDYKDKSQWFSDNDPVLSIAVTENNAEIEATDLGITQILIMDKSLSLIKRLTINVVEAIVEPAKTLNLSADEPVSK